MRVRCYVDGLNFYYNVAQVIGFKWIDLERCLRVVLHKHLRTEVTIEQLAFFASAVQGPSRNRQAVYYGALRAHSKCVDIRLGRFKQVQKHGLLLRGCRHCGQGKGDKATIHAREEKHTDVNLATAIVHDAHAHADKFDLACLVSNDSDLSAALGIKQQMGQRTILLCPLVKGGPRGKSPSVRLRKELLNNQDCITHLVADDVRQCELPAKVGKYCKPQEWA